ncbi:MAG: hypothetical protein EA377_03075 [Phycisphaerales bacterium]|nr:MAG: hypothetical protein EA377_03075 [Phycisphaerales bacterium]
MLTYRESRAKEFLAQESDEVVRAEYIKPLIMLGIGMAVTFLGLFFGAFGESGLLFAVGGMIAVAIVLTLTVIIAFFGLAIASYLFSLDAGPITLVLIRLAGIFAIMMPVNLLIPVGGLLWGIGTLLILSGLVAMLFDFELFEAVISVIIMKLVNLVVMIAIMAYFSG